MSLFNNFKYSQAHSYSKQDPCSWFSGDTGRYLFRSSGTIYNNDFSGLLLVKPTGESYRILFITEMGMKIFDMEFFREGNYNVHYAAGAIDRKPVIRTLGNDLSLMLFNVGNKGIRKEMIEKGTEMKIIKSKDRSGTIYTRINGETGRAEELIGTGTLFNKLNIKFSGTGQPGPDSIAITHYNRKLNINLSLIVN